MRLLCLRGLHKKATLAAASAVDWSVPSPLLIPGLHLAALEERDVQTSSIQSAVHASPPIISTRKLRGNKIFRQSRIMLYFLSRRSRSDATERRGGVSGVTLPSPPPLHLQTLLHSDFRLLTTLATTHHTLLGGS